MKYDPGRREWSYTTDDGKRHVVASAFMGFVWIGLAVGALLWRACN